MNSILFTPAALLELLTKVDELKDYNIGITENMDGSLELKIGQSVYEIPVSDVTNIQVDDSVVDEVEDINEDTYEALAASGEVSLDEEFIESGVIKELAKSVLLGGMVRLSKKLLD